MRFDTLRTVGAWLALCGAPALAQAPPEEPPIYHQGEIIVTAEAPRVVEEVTTVETVTAREILDSGASTVDEAVTLLPGLQLRLGAEGVELLDVRGLRTRNVLLLLDGVPLNSSFDGFFDPRTLPVESVARVKLVRGAGSVLYGPAGNGGVLDVVTRAAGAGATGLLRLEGGEDARRAAARGAWGRGAFGVSAAASYSDRDAFELSGDFEPTALENGGERLGADREDRSLFSTWTWDPSDRRSFGLHLTHRSGAHGKPPVTEDFRTNPFAPRARFERADFDALSAHAAGTFAVGSRLTLRPILYLNRNDEITDGFDDGGFDTQTAAGAFREDAGASTTGASLQITGHRGKRVRWTLGADARREAYDARGFELQVVGGGGGGGGMGGGGGGGGNTVRRMLLDEDESVRVASLAAETEWRGDGPWSAVAGAGYAAQSRDGRDDDDGVQALVGARRGFGSAWSARGSLARRIRFPTLRDLYGAGRGNPDLEAETTHHVELGLERLLGAAGDRVELVLYRIDGDDFIQGLPGEPLANLEDTRRQGVEVVGRHAVAAHRLYWSYTYLDAEDRSPDADLRTIQNQPRHKGTLAATLVLPFGLEGRGDVLHVADSYALTRTRPTRRQELGDYTVLGLGLARRLGDRVRIQLRVDNALDENYFESVGFPSPGREWLLRLDLGGGR